VSEWWRADCDLVLWYVGSPLPVSRSWLIIRLSGSSRGRGTRAAGWFQDLIEDRQVSGITSAILLDGITGWARAGEEYTRLMEEYVPEHWLKAK
jgi:hypothetical protein